MQEDEDPSCTAFPLLSEPESILLGPDADPAEPVSTFQYLGSTVSQDCSFGAEVTSRIIKASQAFGSLSRKLWLQWRIKTRTKIRVFASIIIPTLLYGLGCVVLLECEVHRLQSFVMRCLCTILSISIWDNKNQHIHKQDSQAATCVHTPVPVQAPIYRSSCSHG